MAGVNIGMDAIGATSTSPRHELGQRAEVGGNVFRYVYHTGTVTLSQYYPAQMAATNKYYVADTGADLDNKLVMGIAATDIAPSEYGWVCIGGVYLARFSASHETTGSPVQGGGTFLTVVSATADKPLGFTLGVSTAAGNVPVYLRME